MSYLTDDLSMASVNMAKVVDINEVIADAETALENHRLTEDNRRLITDTLNKIKETEDYEVTPEMVNEIDGVMHEVSAVTVDKNGKSDLIIINGTEEFGLTLTPKEWRLNRIAGCESLLEELNKNIKRWANKLSSKLNELWVNNRYNLESLKERVAQLDNRFSELEGKTSIQEFVNIPAIINGTLSVKGKPLTTNIQLESLLANEVNLIFTTIKMWNMETVDFKNRFIKYFGNKANGPLKLISRPHSRFFSKKSFINDEDAKLINWTIPQNNFIGGGGIWFCENTNEADDLITTASNLEKTGYVVIQSKDNKTVLKGYEDIKISPLSLKRLDKIYDVITKIISIMEGLNQKNNDFDLSDNDVKDILNTIKSLDDSIILDAYAGISTHYQIDVTATQTGFIKYLHNLCSHLITFIFINLDGYDE